MRTSTERGSRSGASLRSSFFVSKTRDDDWTKGNFSKFFVLNETMWQRVALTVFPQQMMMRRRRLCVYVCARSATSIASFSVSICPFEIDDLSSDQAKGKTTANSRARLRLLLYKFWFELFGGRSCLKIYAVVASSFWSSSKQASTTKKIRIKKSSRTRRRRTHHRKIYVFFFFFFFFFSQQRQNRKRRAHRASNKIIVENGDVNSALVFVL